MDRRIQVFVGAYGSGKSEVAINYAFQAKIRRGLSSVAIADLDLVNPYFRSRELRDAFEAQGIRVLGPAGELAHADLPVIVPEIRGWLDHEDVLLVLDVGGDDAGARALSQFATAIDPADAEVYLVVNNRRPWTGTPAGVADVIRRIEANARMRITALVSNPNLGDETTREVVVEGHAAIREAAVHVGLPIAFLCVSREIEAADPVVVDVPILALDRQLFPPWYEDPLRLAPYHDQRARVLLRGARGLSGTTGSSG